MRSTDNGKTWSKVVNDSGGIVALISDSDGQIFAGMLGFAPTLGLLKSRDDGLTWTKTSHCSNGADLTDIRTIVTGSGGKVYAAGGRGFVLSDDRGQTWTAANDGLPEGLRRNVQALLLDSHSTLIAGSYGGISRFSADDRKWADVGPSGISVDSLIVSPLGGILAATSERGILRSANGGVDWQPFSPSVLGKLVGEFAVSTKKNLFAAVGTTGVFRSSDGGLSWQKVFGSEKKTITYSTTTSSRGEVFISVGSCCPVYKVELLRSVDEGKTWIKILEIGHDVAFGPVLVTQKGTILVGLTGVGD